MKYRHVDSVNVFRLLDRIVAQRTGGFVKDFETFDDIANWLREQWAGLFADYLARMTSENQLLSLASRLSELGSITRALKWYSETIIRRIQPDEAARIIGEQDTKLEEANGARLMKEGMLTHIQLAYKRDLSPLGTLHALRDSSGLNDFLLRIGLKDKEVEEFMLLHAAPAERDYSILRDQYSHAPSSSGSISTGPAQTPDPK